MEQANYAAAVEQELAKSILRISTVKHARVNLALPQQSVFVRDRTPPKASVVITRYPGRHMDANQVNAIINLVASSVPYLNPTDVSVVDSLGNLLSDTSQENPLGMTSAAASQAANLRTRTVIESINCLVQSMAKITCVLKLTLS